MFNCTSPTKTCWCFTLVQRRQTWLRMKYVSFVSCSLLIYLPHLKGAGNLFAQKASFINCTKDLKQISLLQIFVYFRKMFLGRRRKWSWKIWVDIVRNILPEQLSRCQCTEGQKPLGQEDHLNPTEKLQLYLSHYLVFHRWNSYPSILDMRFVKKIKMQKLWLFLLEMKQCKCNRTSKFSIGLFKFNWICRKSTVSV